MIELKRGAGSDYISPLMFSTDALSVVPISLVSGNNDNEDREKNQRVLGHRLAAGRFSSPRI